MDSTSAELMLSHVTVDQCDTASNSSTFLHDSAISFRELLNTASVSDCIPCHEQRSFYIVGLRMTALRHDPPAPFGKNYNTPLPSQHPNPTAISQEELCFARRPLEGRTYFEDTKDLTIISLIRTGAGCGPQLVLVNGGMVAKIYDPMYYDSSEYPDVVWYADRTYSREAAAYGYLHNSADVSDIVPAFHGTWTLDIDTAITQNGRTTTYTRPVRMILIEYLEGLCMEATNAHKLSEHALRVILKQCLDAQMRILHAGVNHGDFYPRNIMILGIDFSTPDVQVKLIDFDVSEVYNHPNYADQEFVRFRKKFTEKWSPRVASPIKRFFGHMMDFSCNGWCPGGFDGAENWLWQNYCNDDRYISVQWNSNGVYGFPMYVDALGRIDDPDYNEDEEMDWESGSETEASSHERSSNNSG